jgi:putative ABC transport system permease protein
MLGVKVTDIVSVEKVIGSSLTVINLRGMTALELSFSVLLVASASSLIFALGFEERKKTFISLLVMGKLNHLRAFVWSEGLTLLSAGIITGLISGIGLAGLLGLMLTYIFNPPPDTFRLPTAYLVLLLAAMIMATISAILHAIHAARQAGVNELRSL